MCELIVQLISNERGFHLTKQIRFKHDTGTLTLKRHFRYRHFRYRIFQLSVTNEIMSKVKYLLKPAHTLLSKITSSFVLEIKHTL